MAEDMIDSNPDAVSLDEWIVATLALAAATPPVSTDAADLTIDTINALRKVRPAVAAVAETHGLTLDQPVGVPAAVRIVAEAGVFVAAELAVTR